MSWKKYGGLNELESFNYITTKNIVTDNLTLRNEYVGIFSINGDLVVSNVSTHKGLVHFKEDVDFSKSLSISGDVKIYGNTYQYKPLYFVGISGQGFNRNDSSGMYLVGDTSGIGINKMMPNSTLDIYGTRVESLNVYSDQSSNRNILSRNNQNAGIILNTNTDAAYIEFYHTDISINSSNYSRHGGGTIRYEPSGILTLDTSTNIHLLSTVSVSNRNDGLVSHVNGETLVVYDISSGIYLSSNYDNSACYTGTALSLIASDLSSITFLKITNKDGSKGWGWGAGTYPNDTSRSMATMGWTDICKNYIPNQTIVSGNSSIHNRSTIGINTYSPITEKYIMDINGPIRLSHNEVHLVGDISFEILSMSFSKRPNQQNYGIAVGSFKDVNLNSAFAAANSSYSFYSAYTMDGGKRWYISSKIEITTANVIYDIELRVYMYDISYAFLSSKNGIYLYSDNQGQTWKRFGASSEINYGSNTLKDTVNYVTKINDGNNLIRTYICFNDSNSKQIITIDCSGDAQGNPTNIFSNNSDNFYDVSLSIINACHGSESYFYIAGNGIQSFDILSGGFIPMRTDVYSSSNILYRCIKTFDGIFTIAAGDNIISYTTNSGLIWTDYSGSVVHDISFHDICIYDASNIIIVGNDSLNAGKIIFSTDSANTWNLLTTEMVNSMGGNSSDIFKYKITSISIQPDLSNAFIITSSVTSYTTAIPGKSNIYCLYFSSLFNRQIQPALLDISGNMVVSGDVHINEDGRICTTNDTFYILDQCANTIYFGRDASNIHIGQSISGGTTYIQHGLDVSDNARIGKVVYTNSIQQTWTDMSLYIGTSLPGKSIIIGGSLDKVIITGEVEANNIKNLEVQNPRIYLNIDNPFPNSSAYSGIYIFDNSNVSAGYIRVSGGGTMTDNLGATSYIFKAPGGPNVVQFDISSMTIDTLANENVVMKLKRSIYSDSSYSMVASSLDISNIFIKNIARAQDITNNTQTISTNLGISGNLFINKDVSGITNTALDVSGNVIVSKLGIGTLVVNPTYNLEVSGNISQSTGWIHQF